MNHQRNPLNDSRIRQTADAVWHTLYHHHRSRPEDWSVQQGAHPGFHRMPDGFLARISHQYDGPSLVV